MKRKTMRPKRRNGSFQISVAGSVNPLQQSIRIKGPVTGLKLFNDRFPPCWDLQQLVKFVAPYNLPARERALRIWHFVRMHLAANFYARERGRPVAFGRDLIKHLNVYASGACGSQSRALAAFYREAGFRARAVSCYGHSVCEVHYDGRWHFMDTIHHETFALLTDDDSCKALEKNRDLTWALCDEEDFVINQTYYSEVYAREREVFGYLHVLKPEVNSLSLTLSEYATVDLYGYPKGHFITHPYLESDRKSFVPYEPLNYGNVHWNVCMGSFGKAFSDDTDAYSLESVRLSNNVITLMNPNKPGAVEVPFASPFVLTDGFLEIDGKGKLALQFSCDDGLNWIDLKRGKKIDLTEHLRERYRFKVRITLHRGAGLRGLRIAAWAQCVAYSLPLLLSGGNGISYEATQCDGAAIEYRWKPGTHRPDWSKSSVEVSSHAAVGGFIRVKALLRDSRGRPVRQWPIRLRSSRRTDIPLSYYSVGSSRAIAEKRVSDMSLHTTDLDGVANWAVICKEAGTRSLRLLDLSGETCWKSKRITVFQRRVQNFTATSETNCVGLAWQPVKGAKRYAIQVTRLDGPEEKREVSVSGRCTEFRLNEKQGLRRGRDYAFRVTVPDDPDCASSRGVTASFGNLAFGKKATCPTTLGWSRLERITAGRRHEKETRIVHLGNRSDKNDVTIDLGKIRRCSRIIYDNISSSDRQTDVYQPAFRFEGSKDGKRFKLLAERKGEKKAQRFVMDFMPVDVRYVRLRIHETVFGKLNFEVSQLAYAGYVEIYDADGLADEP